MATGRGQVLSRAAASAKTRFAKGAPSGRRRPARDGNDIGPIDIAALAWGAGDLRVAMAGTGWSPAPDCSRRLQESRHHANRHI